MIARIWRGWTRREDAEAYAAYMRETGLPGYAATPGNLGTHMLRRDDGERTEFVMVTFWDSWEAIRRFAGPEPERAVFYPRDDGFLVEREESVTHYEVLSP